MNRFLKMLGWTACAITAPVPTAAAATLIFISDDEGKMDFDLIRPSTIMRLAEDTIIGGVKMAGRGLKATGHKAKRVKHNIGIEYTARTLARMQRRIERDSTRLESMTHAEIKQIEKDQQQILKRVEQLRHKSYKAPKLHNTVSA